MTLHHPRGEIVNPRQSFSSSEAETEKTEEEEDDGGEDIEATVVCSCDIHHHHQVKSPGTLQLSHWERVLVKIKEAEEKTMGGILLPSTAQGGEVVAVGERRTIGKNKIVKVDASTIAISCWRGKNSFGIMVTSADCQELLERLAERTPKTEGGSVNGSNGRVVLKLWRLCGLRFMEDVLLGKRSDHTVRTVVVVLLMTHPYNDVI
ncbi:unnamed protein product [Brassica oleracea var. botrytis]